MSTKNDESRLNEKNFFNVFRHIPVIGLVYSLGRGAIKKKQGKEDEANQSFHRDFANLNPIRSVTNMVRDTVASFGNKEEGIWIGKKGLRNKPFGLTLSPGIDMYHWAIMIRGTVYQLRRNLQEHNKTNVGISTDERLKNSYHWFMYRKSNLSIKRTDEELQEFIKSFEKNYFSSFAVFENPLLSKENEKVNCQYLANRFIVYATGLDFYTVQAELIVIMGTILF